MQAVPYPAARFPASPFSSARVRLLPEPLARVRHCVPANGVQCIRPAQARPERVPWALAPDFRRPEQLVPAPGPAAHRAVPDSATFLVE